MPSNESSNDKDAAFQPGDGVQGGTDQTAQDTSARQEEGQDGYQHVNQDDEADRLRGTPDDRPLAARQESSDEVGTARPSKN